MAKKKASLSSSSVGMGRYLYTRNIHFLAATNEFLEGGDERFLPFVYPA